MRRIRWRPENGWRAFSTELIVVVLGVLIALGAEQIISGLRRQGEVSSLRSALHEELSDNLASYNYRFSEQACVANRLAELKALRARALAGEIAGVVGEIGRPPSASLRASVWSARSSEVMDAMPLDQRLAYSYIYDELAFNFDLMNQEREPWRSLARFNGIRKLNDEDARTLSELIFRVETIDAALRFNAPDIQQRFARMGIRPSERIRQLLGNDDGPLCNPLSR
ncbi:MAG: hypothetical protein V4808_16450 [Pseudomonadota bacterium]